MKRSFAAVLVFVLGACGAPTGVIVEPPTTGATPPAPSSTTTVAASTTTIGSTDDAEVARTDGDFCQRLKLVKLTEGIVSEATDGIDALLGAASESGVQPDLTLIIEAANEAGGKILRGSEDLSEVYGLALETAPPGLYEHLTARTEFMGIALPILGEAMATAATLEDAQALAQVVEDPAIVSRLDALDASDVALNDYAQQECGFVFTN